MKNSCVVVPAQRRLCHGTLFGRFRPAVVIYLAAPAE